MFIRVYIEGTDKEGAKKTVERLVSVLEGQIIEYNVEKLELYWKIEGMFVAEIQTKTVFKEICEEDLKNITAPIADKWKLYGDPLEGLYASKNDEELKYLMENINFIELIFY